jgi:integrase
MSELQTILNEFDNWLKQNTILNEKSRKQYVLQMKKFFVVYKKLSVDELRKFIIDGERSYIRKFAVRRFLEFSEEYNWVEQLKPIMKMIKLKDRRYERYIDFRHFKQFLDYIFNKHSKLAVALMIMWDTGVRVSPIINLRVRDVQSDADGSYIYVTEKGGKQIKRYLDADTTKLLHEFITVPDDYMFRKKLESWWECYYRMWKELKTTSRKFLNVGYGISFHWIRTSRAKELYKKYKDVLLVKGFLGHKKIDTTMRYIEEGEISSVKIIKEEKGKWEK